MDHRGKPIEWHIRGGGMSETLSLRTGRPAAATASPEAAKPPPPLMTPPLASLPPRHGQAKQAGSSGPAEGLKTPPLLMTPPMTPPPLETPPPTPQPQPEFVLSDTGRVLCKVCVEHAAVLVCIDCDFFLCGACGPEVLRPDAVVLLAFPLSRQ